MASGGRPQRDAQKVSAILNGADDPANSVRFYDFDRFRLDAKRRLLTRDGEPIGIKPKALETLLLLLRHRDRLLDKEELMTRLWPDTTVEEANLTQNIFVIRKALGEAPGEQRFIATVARQGYRFVADVVETSEEEDADPAPVKTEVQKRSSRRMLVAAAVLLVLVGGLVLALARQKMQRAGAGTVRSIAVLPFRNLSADSNDQYFADGVTEAIRELPACRGPGAASTDRPARSPFSDLASLPRARARQERTLRRRTR